VSNWGVVSEEALLTSHLDVRISHCIKGAFLMQIIDISHPGFLEIMRKTEAKGNCRQFMLTWNGITPPVSLKVYGGCIPGQASTVAGIFDPFDYSISIATYGRRQNETLHRGGLEGTVAHEWAHLLQCLGSDNDVGGWYFTNHHDTQSTLFQKWKSVFDKDKSYAGEAPYEAAAELFRVLAGWPSSSPEEWESNAALLQDWREFLKGNEMFKHYMP